MSEPGTVQIDTGVVRGVEAGEVRAFLNVPFAAPPVGDWRWKAPQPAACWQGTRDATAWGPKCPQRGISGKGPLEGEEDCLQLNIWAPRVPPVTPAPVAFWIHGGGHTIGSATEEISGVRIYDGQKMAEATGMVVVTANYRLGALGFLAHPALRAEDEHESTGNYGILDLIAALGWVQRNAQAFGGDPGKVMIFGESAGAVNVCSLVASPLAKGLFHGAVMQSGGCVAKELSDAEAFGSKVFEGAGCGGQAGEAACMRGISVEQVLDAGASPIQVAGAAGPYGPLADGWVHDGQPLATIAAGKHNQVPMIVGSNSDETSRSVPLKETATEAEYEAAVGLLFKSIGPQVLTMYPAASYPSPWHAYVALTSDVKFVCGARKALRALHKGQSSPVFRYHFEHQLDNAVQLQKYGAWHGLDVLFVFDSLDVGGYPPSKNETALSGAFQGYWAGLAAKGDPNGDGAVAWPAYSDDDPYLRLGTPVEAAAGLRTEQCDFWDLVFPSP